MNSLLLLIAGDTLLSIIAAYSGSLVRLGSFEIMGMADGKRFVVFMAVIVFSSYILELYNYDRQLSRKETLLRVLMALVLSFLCLTAIYYMMDSVMFGRGLLILSLVL